MTVSSRDNQLQTNMERPPGPPFLHSHLQINSIASNESRRFPPNENVSRSSSTSSASSSCRSGESSSDGSRSGENFSSRSHSSGRRSRGSNSCESCSGESHSSSNGSISLAISHQNSNARNELGGNNSPINLPRLTLSQHSSNREVRRYSERRFHSASRSRRSFRSSSTLKSRSRSKRGSSSCSRRGTCSRSDRETRSRSNRKARSRSDRETQYRIRSAGKSSSRSLSEKSRSRIRFESMYKLHQQRRAANRSLPRQSDSHHHQETLNEVREIKKNVKKNENRFDEIDRRLSRLEMTANKSLIVLNDLSDTINVRMLLGNVLPLEIKPPKGFYMPKLPIKHLKDLITLKKDLECSKEFYNFLVKYYCTPSGSTDTVTMTSYLRRFINVDLKASLVLKELKGQPGLTLYHDFNKIYIFLKDVMISGYNTQGKIITGQQAHIVLRTVWGRSKQAKNENLKRRRRH